MKYAGNVGSVVTTYIHNKFHKDWFRYSKVNRSGYTDTKTQTETVISYKPTFSFQNKVSSLKVL
jgi:hypothetical protein